MRRPIRVFLLDDHEVVRRGVRSSSRAEADLEVVGRPAPPRRRSAASRRPVRRRVLDVRLPDGSGVEVCREIRSRTPRSGA